MAKSIGRIVTQTRSLALEALNRAEKARARGDEKEAKRQEDRFQKISDTGSRYLGNIRNTVKSELVADGINPREKVESNHGTQSFLQHQLGYEEGTDRKFKREEYMGTNTGKPRSAQATGNLRIPADPPANSSGSGTAKGASGHES